MNEVGKQAERVEDCIVKRWTLLVLVMVGSIQNGVYGQEDSKKLDRLTVSQLVATASSPSSGWDRRVDALDGLVKLKDVSAVKDVILFSVTETNKEMCAVAFQSLLDMSAFTSPSDQRMLKAVVNATFTESSDELKSLMCKALESLDDTNSVQRVLSILRDEFGKKVDDRGRSWRRGFDSDLWRKDVVVEKAVNCLLKHGTKRRNEILACRAANKGNDMAYCLAHVLWKLGEQPDRDTIRKGIVACSSPWLRRLLVADVEEMKDKEAVPFLEKALKDDYTVPDKAGMDLYPIREGAKRVLHKLSQ